MAEVQAPAPVTEQQSSKDDIDDTTTTPPDIHDLLDAAEAFVKHHFREHDPSHDWLHVQRVRLMALNLTRCPSLAVDGEDTEIDCLVVELGALFHDLCDAKYVDKAAKGATTAVRAVDVLGVFLAPYLACGAIEESQVQAIYRIVDSVSWSREEARRERIRRSDGQPSEADAAQQAWEDGCAEFKCISDADRLDAIGSIGILRVAAFSAVKNRPLYLPPANAANDPVPPAEQATGYNGSAVAHFYEKLLKIRGDRLKTDMARDEAERRQSMMSSFLAELDLEWLVADQGAQLSLFA